MPHQQATVVARRVVDAKSLKRVRHVVDRFIEAQQAIDVRKVPTRGERAAVHFRVVDTQSCAVAEFDRNVDHDHVVAYRNVLAKILQQQEVRRQSTSE